MRSLNDRSRKLVLNRSKKRLAVSGDADDQAFSSLFSSFRNRQSVPCAMSFCGLS